MMTEDHIHKLIKYTKIKTNPEVNKTVLNNLLGQMDRAEGVHSNAPQQNTWRIIMNSNKTKCATAAAVILIGVMIGLNFMNGSPDGAGKVYAMSDVPELLRKAKTSHIHGWVYFDQPDRSNEDTPGLELDYWIDMENRSFYIKKPINEIDSKTGERNYSTTICDGEYLMSEIHSKSPYGEIKKEIKYEKLSEFHSRLMTYKKAHNFILQMFEGIDPVEGFSHSGVEEIDGILYDMWEGEIGRNPRNSEYAKIKGWLSPQTGKIGRVELSVTEYTLVIDKIELNITLPEDIFLTDPPEGYPLRNTKETAPWKEFGDPYVGLGPLHMIIPISFTLGDGSVIVCWRSLDNTEPDQKVLFEELKIGGDLPKLPIEIYGLEATPATLKIVYKGYHLTHTYKNDKFYEWSLYVPDAEIPNRNTIISYQVLYQYNADKEKNTSSLKHGINEDLLIETKDKFNTWVLGAMAELNDDGVVPEGMSYESVLELSEQLRFSLEN